VLDCYIQALNIYRIIGDRDGEAATLHNMASVYYAPINPHEALRYFIQSLKICRETGNRDGEATVLNNISTTYFKLGDKKQAFSYLEQSLPLSRAVGDRGGEAVILFNMSFLTEDSAQAIALVQQSYALWVAVQSPDARDAAQRLAELRGK
jgi:tetratricopeptide (TPR) repeat protein